MYFLYKLKFRQKSNCKTWQKRWERGGEVLRVFERDLAYEEKGKKRKKPEISGKAGKKRAWQHRVAMVEYSHMSEHVHHPILRLSIAQEGANFNRDLQNWYILRAKCPVDDWKWCIFCSSWIRTARFDAKFEVFANRILWMSRLL